MRFIIVAKDGLVQTAHSIDQWEQVKSAYEGCDVFQWEGEIPPQGSPDPRLDPTSEPIRIRHEREQAAGVPLTNGWRIKYGKADRDELGALKNTIDLIGPELEAAGEMVPIIEANGTIHMLTPTDMLPILKEYAMLALIQYSRQAVELASQ